jgi:hypothetical protein
VTEHNDDAAELQQLEASGLFDTGWYLQQNDDVREAALEPLPHFHRFGWREGRRPNLYFDPAWYLEHYPDVLAANMDPLLHYLRHGDHEGRRPVWHFDPAWYCAVYELAPDALALAHFLTERTSGRFAPMPELYAVLHMPPYRDDPASGEDPFAHYLDDMLREQREAFPDLQVVTASGLIDPNYYLINGSDVHEAALDPAEHFCRYGWRESRKPNIYFDMHWYLHTNPLVAHLKINPVMHYILVGEAAGRRPVPYFDPAWYRETYAIEPGQNALAHFLAHRRSQRFSPTPSFDVAWYVEQHADELGPNRDPFAHYLQAGTYRDIDPSPAFSASEYRKRHLGRPSRQFRQLMHPDRDNPLVHHLRAQYR